MVRGKEKGALVFVVLVMLLLMLPFVGLAWDHPEPLSDQESQSSMPSFIDENGQVAVDYLSSLGDYFEENFAYRTQAIDLNARLRVACVATSPTDQVIVGKDEWLYYGGTLKDYLGRTKLSERKAFNIAHNLSLMQDYVVSKGSQFVFTIAPNKNSLYPEHMPYYYRQGDDSNRAILKSSLEQQNISYVDMFELFGSYTDEYYHKTDSHWNDEGAYLAACALMKACSHSLPKKQGASVGAHEGDVEAMLYPWTATAEQAPALTTGEWNYDANAASVKDSFIETSSASGSGSVLMFRDSFGDALLPLMAPSFEKGYFSKLVPYNLFQLDTLKPDYVIVERAERHVGDIAINPPLIPAPKTHITADSSFEVDASITCSSDGGYRVISGSVNGGQAAAESDFDDILIQVDSASKNTFIVVPFYISISVEGVDEECDYGFQAYVPQEALGEEGFSVTILVTRKDAYGTNEAVASSKTVGFN